MTTINSMTAYALQYRPLYIMTGTADQQLLVYTDQIKLVNLEGEMLGQIFFTDMTSVVMTAPADEAGYMAFRSADTELEFTYENSLQPRLQAKIIYGHCNRQMEIVHIEESKQRLSQYAG